MSYFLLNDKCCLASNDDLNCCLKNHHAVVYKNIFRPSKFNIYYFRNV